jgi:geranyl-CoA carboxylase alpha subunit
MGGGRRVSGIDVLLVANRGEIATRVMRTAKALGMTTVAVYSEADADAPHVRAADMAVCIGPPPVGESYLSIDRILDAARKSGAQAIHPGYGFLSENAAFAERCADAGLIFVGPPPQAIRLMGDKVQAKLRMIEAGVPTAPGYHGSTSDGDRLASEAARIGYPLLVKASAGGGGRGMRIVRDAASLASAVESASSEAKGAFGSGEVFLEKLVVGARHIEIQVFCDSRGGAVHLGERECSVQRRHQKIIEEAPSPVVDAGLRAAMGGAAVAAAKAIGYVGAGTIEFLLDDDRNFYFLEMNTRLQVEHPVTEQVTGQDLVAWQLRVAEGGRLPLAQSQIELTGHAIEARLYAEDPHAGFLPQTGDVLRWRPADAACTRIDAGIREGQAVSPFYDPMLAKLIGTGQSRAEAIRAVRAAVKDSVILGVTTNRAFLLELLGSDAFAKADIRTDTLDDRYREAPPPRPEPSRLAWVAAALARHGSAGDGWRSSGVYATHVELACGAAKKHIRVAARGRNVDVEITGEPAFAVVLHDATAGRIAIETDGVRRTLDVAVRDREVFVDDAGVAHVFTEPSPMARAEEAGPGDGKVRAPMGGRVVRVEVAAGDRVTKGQTLLVIEAMKMEHRVTAPQDGVVQTLGAEVGAQVAARAIVAVVGE